MSNTTSSPELPREFRYDASSCSFVTGGAVIRVLALPAGDAGEVVGAKEQVQELYGQLYERAGFPFELGKSSISRGFLPAPEDASKAVLLGRTVLVYYDAKPEAPSDRIAAFSRVTFDGERFVVAAISPTSELSEDAVRQVLRATVLVTEQLVLAIESRLFGTDPKQPVLVWRSKFGASDFLKELLEKEGYSSKLTERLEMTAWLKELGSADAVIAPCEVDGLEIRPLDLVHDDLVAVFAALKPAFGPGAPSFAAWKCHYLEQPRFAPELSFVAWVGATPVAVSMIELIVEGEGGGDDEIAKMHTTDAQLNDETKHAALTQPLAFADDYEDRKRAIREKTTRAFVCDIATAPEMRGKRLAQTLLRHQFQAAARAGFESVCLGTDRFNTPAVRAYTRVGMVETKSIDHGYSTAKLLHASP